MAAVAVVIVELAAGDLLRIEAEFGIGLAALDVAARGKQASVARADRTREVEEVCGKLFSSMSFSNDFNHTC